MALCNRNQPEDSDGVSLSKEEKKTLIADAIREEIDNSYQNATGTRLTDEWEEYFTRLSAEKIRELERFCTTKEYFSPHEYEKALNLSERYENAKVTVCIRNTDDGFSLNVHSLYVEPPLSNDIVEDFIKTFRNSINTTIDPLANDHEIPVLKLYIH